MKTFIGFSHPKKLGLLTRIAMWLDGIDVSHAFLSYFDEDWHCQMVVQLDEFGFRLIPADRYEKENHIKYLLDAPEKFDVGMGEVARKYAGTMYDFRGFLGMALVLAFRKLGVNIKNPFASPDTMICTEMIALAVVKSGYELPDGLVVDSISPKGLLTAVKKLKG